MNSRQRHIYSGLTTLSVKGNKNFTILRHLKAERDFNIVQMTWELLSGFLFKSKDKEQLPQISHSKQYEWDPSVQKVLSSDRGQSLSQVCDEKQPMKNCNNVRICWGMFLICGYKTSILTLKKMDFIV